MVLFTSFYLFLFGVELVGNKTYELLSVELSGIRGHVNNSRHLHRGHPQHLKHFYLLVLLAPRSLLQISLPLVRPSSPPTLKPILVVLSTKHDIFLIFTEIVGHVNYKFFYILLQKLTYYRKH